VIKLVKFGEVMDDLRLQNRSSVQWTGRSVALRHRLMVPGELNQSKRKTPSKLNWRGLNGTLRSAKPEPFAVRKVPFLVAFAEPKKKPSPFGLGFIFWYSQGESNPCFRRERPAS
jgi:hypothetical protein